jgi:hypothetical protein
MKSTYQRNRSRLWSFELLEDRLTPTQTPWTIPIQGVNDIIVDDTRHLLYVTTGLGKIERYDWINHQLLSPIIVGSKLAGGDITPDGNTLVVADRTPQGSLSVVHKINLIDQSVTDVAFAREPFFHADNGGSYDVAILSNQTAWITISGTGYVTLKTFDLNTNTVDVYYDANNASVSISGYSSLVRSVDRSATSIQSTLSTWLAHPADNVLTEYAIPGNYSGGTGHAQSWSPDGELFTMQAKDSFVSINHADGSPDQLVAANAAIYSPDGKYFLRYYFDEYNAPKFIAQNRLSGEDEWSLPVDDSNPVVYSRPNSAYGSIGVFSSDSHFLFTHWGSGIRIYELPDPNEHGVATQFKVTPSQPFVMVGTPTTFQVTAKDDFGRTVTDYADSILIGVYGSADLENTTYTFQPEDQGTHSFDITFLDTIDQTSFIGVEEPANFHVRGRTAISVIDPHLLTYNIYPYVTILLHDSARNQFFAISDNHILQFDMNQHRLLRAWEVGGRPLSMALSLDGQTLFVTEGVAQLHGMTVYRIDVQTDNISRVEALPDQGESRFDRIVATSDGKFLLTTQNSDGGYGLNFQLRVLDPQSNTIDYYGGSFGTALLTSLTKMTATSDGQHVLFATNSGNIRWFDTASGFDVFNMNLSYLGIYPEAEAVSRDGQLFAIRTNNLNNNQLIVVNRQGEVVQSFDSLHLQFDPYRDLAYVYLSNVDGTSSVRVFNTVTWNMVFEYQIFSLDNQPVGGFTQHIPEKYSGGYPIGIPVPPVNQIWLAASDTSVLEGDVGLAYLQFPVRLSQAATTAVTVQFTTESDDAIAGQDYLPVSGTLTFAPGQTLIYVKVAVPGNIVPQGNRHIFLRLAQATGAYLVDESAQGAIEDTDIPNYARFDSYWAIGMESNPTIPIHLTLERAMSMPVSVSYHLERYESVDSDVVPASLGKDVTGIRGKVTFLPGQTVASFPIKIINDATDEFNEAFYIVLDHADGGIWLDDNETLNAYTILDDDAAPVVSLTTKHLNTREGAGTYYLQASLNHPSEKTVSVDVDVQGTASRSDFISLPFYFAPGKITAKTAMDIVDDTAYEKYEAAILRLVVAENATVKRGQTAILSILDNDSPPVFVMEGNPATFYRNGAEYYLFANMTRYTEVPYLVRPIIFAGTTAVEGRDYVWIKQTMHGTGGVSSDYLSLRILPQPAGTPSRTLKLGLRAIYGATTGQYSGITIHMVDNPGL